VIRSELSARKAAKLCLRPKAQAHHFIERARKLLADIDPFKLQAFNERLEANRRLVTPEIEEMIINEYLAGASQGTLRRKYRMWWATVRKILIKHGIFIRQGPEQLALHFHGRVPNVVPGLTKEKLYVAFTMLGDNAGRNHALKEHNYKLGIAAGSDYHFAKVWCDNFEKTYGIRPRINERNPKSLIADIGCKQAWLDLHQYFSFGTYDWDIKPSAMRFLQAEASIDSLGYALQAFSEAEGYLRFANYNSWDRRIFIRSVNLRGLQRIARLFLRVGISPKLYHSKNSHVLVISKKKNIQKYLELVGFTSKRKQALLEKAINSYSTVTDLARWRGLSGSKPRSTLM
jgi:hypothetical protein